MRVEKAIVIDEPWISEILAGRKIWGGGGSVHGAIAARSASFARAAASSSASLP